MTWRTEILALVPWVRGVRRPTPCDGYRPMSGRARSDPELRERHRCRNDASWRFVALRSSWGRSGAYCYAHLVNEGLYGDPREERRITRWFERHLDAVNGVRARHGLPPLLPHAEPAAAPSGSVTLLDEGEDV